MNNEPLHPFMKGLLAFLLMLIPTLGTLILRSDPVMSSTASAPDTQSIQTVQTFAKFIQTKPELAKALAPPLPAPASALIDPGNHRLEPMTDGQREVIANAVDAWQKPGVVRNEQWRAEIEKLLYIAEATGSLDALDFLSTQITLARKDVDELNRSKADQWLDRYLSLEHRENKRKEVVDFFREAVLGGIK